MKKKRILILAFLFCIVMTIVILFKFHQYTESLEGKIKSNCDSYKEYWELDYIALNEESNEIKVAFSVNKNRMSDIDFISDSSLVCREITDYLFSENFEYIKMGYYLDYSFKYTNGVNFHVENIYPGMETLSVRFSTYDFEVKDVAKWYPETDDATISGTFQLEDLAEFKNLKHLYISKGITQEEKKLIFSYFPNIDLGFTEIVDE